MADERDEQLPPLGEATPAFRSRPDGARSWYRRAWVVGVAGLVVGLLVGFGLGWVVDDGDADGVAIGETGEVERTPAPPPPPPTTTTLVTVPPECVDAMRSAQQSLSLLDQGFQGLRQLDVGEVDRMLADLRELRRNLGDRVRECLERA